MFEVRGLNVFITGGTAGIGLATARRFAEAGASVAFLGRRDGKALADELGALFLRCDVSDESQLAAAFEGASEALGPLDVIVNNAGIDNSGPSIDERDAAEFQRIIDVNLLPVYNGLRYGPRHMRDGGAIVNVASDAALLGLPGYAQYGATKAAVVNLTQNAAMELAPRNIRVNAVCPGTVWSEMVPEGHPEVAIVEAATALGRVGEPSEIAGVIHFLASAEAGYITGQAIVVDGGLRAGMAMHTIERLVR